MTLGRYIKAGKVPAPKILDVGSTSLHAWTEEEIEQVRKLLPKIANGRKTRYQKKLSAVSTRKPGQAQHSAKVKARKKPKKQNP